MIQAFVSDEKLMLNTRGSEFEMASGCMAIINAIYLELKKNDVKSAEKFKTYCGFLLSFSFYTDKEMKEKIKNDKTISKNKNR